MSEAQVVVDTLKNLDKTVQEQGQITQELAKSMAKIAEVQVQQMEIKKSKEDSDAEIKKAVEEVKAELTKSYNEKLQEHDLRFEEIEKSSRKQGRMGNEEVYTAILEKPEVKEALTKSMNGEKVQIDSDIIKSLVSYNNAGVGALQRAVRNAGEIDINLQTSSPVVGLVNTITSTSIKGVVYDTIDTSVLPPEETLEGMTTEQKKDAIKRGVVEIQPSQEKAWNYITDLVIHGIRGGDYRSNPLDAELRALDSSLSKKIARKILNGKVNNGKGVQGILPKALESGTKIAKIPTVTSNTLTLRDVSLVVAGLKADYLRGAVGLIDRKALHSIYNEEAEDGHLKIEYFDYANGIARIRTAEGTFPLVAVESFPNTVASYQHDGFAGYKSFPSAGSDIDSGYIIGGSNSGKAYMVFSNFNLAYTLTRTTTREVGLDDSFKDRLIDGLNVYGMIDYVGGNVTRQEAIAIGYIA